MTVGILRLRAKCHVPGLPAAWILFLPPGNCPRNSPDPLLSSGKKGKNLPHFSCTFCCKTKKNRATLIRKHIACEAMKGRRHAVVYNILTVRTHRGDREPCSRSVLQKPAFQTGLPPFPGDPLSGAETLSLRLPHTIRILSDRRFRNVSAISRWSSSCGRTIP